MEPNITIPEKLTAFDKTTIVELAILHRVEDVNLRISLGWKFIECYVVTNDVLINKYDTTLQYLVGRTKDVKPFNKDEHTTKYGTYL